MVTQIQIFRRLLLVCFHCLNARENFKTRFASNILSLSCSNRVDYSTCFSLWPELLPNALSPTTDCPVVACVRNLPVCTKNQIRRISPGIRCPCLWLAVIIWPHSPLRPTQLWSSPKKIQPWGRIFLPNCCTNHRRLQLM